MTTDARLPLRLYVVAALAAVYTISWRAIGAHTSSAPAAETAAPAIAEPARAVWFEDLPANERPAIAVPAGWQLTSRAGPAPAPRLVRAPARTGRRVRTRSS